jgi:hypothetical protein
MSSTDELLRELEEEHTSTRSPSSDATDEGRRARLKRRAVGVFSPKAFLAALLFMTGGLLVGSAVPLIPGTGLLGVAVASFVYGLVSSERRYLEAGAAGSLVSALGFVLFNMTTLTIGLFNGWGVQLGLLLGVAGFVAAVVGTYFGRDLRAGLTADIPE